ncbi:MAG: RHS repeat protein [Thaumarchaeota archaeon]|nr:RHS repeat protein [Nitrososphaerota archaeon]
MVPLSSASGPGATSQPPGQPLPPGTVSYRNTWNTTAPACPVTPTTQPLVPITTWNKTLRIPTQLFDYSVDPNGQFITQYFTVSSNGTFSVSDSAGNDFSIRPLVGLPPGLLSVSLRGNSTVAEQHFVVSAGPLTLADVLVTYSVKMQFCEPSGIKIAIVGTSAWSRGSGVLGLAFGSKPTLVRGDRAWFGNSSGIGLGFDWSDSASLGPSFGPSSGVLSYNVGTTFSIDPVTVASSSDYNALLHGYAGRVFYANYRWWVFFRDGATNTERWVSSADGISWTAPTTLATACSVTQETDIGFAVSGNQIVYACQNSQTVKSFYFGSGVLNAGGSISWGSESTVPIAYYFYLYAGFTLAFDTSGNYWVQFMGCSVSDCGTGTYTYATVYEHSSLGWSLSLALTYGQFFWAILPLTAGKMALVNYGAGIYQYSFVIPYNGTWGSQVMATRTCNSPQMSSVNSLGDTVELACVSQIQGSANTPLYYESWTYDQSSWSSSAQLLLSSPSAAVTNDGSGDVLLAYFTSPSTLVYQTSHDSGATWGSPVTLSTTESLQGYEIAAQRCPCHGSTIVGFAWESGSSSPYSIRFAALPLLVPTAAVSPNSWSRPGLSPYESYFSEFSDYVSPGNGLVAVEAGTLTLPGRGMSFAPSLVYSEPYAFRSSGSPYLFDNYTGASLGYGWSLNFPWLGANYLHLSDGQAIPYLWNGNTFQYNSVTNFVLTKNTGGTYTLNMSSGTLYRFDTSQRLISITGRTGNNVITFSYGTNGYLSQVTDTIGRTVTFSYNANNQLGSIASGSRTWTFGYTGSQLSSMTDPMNRITYFYYAGTSGANAWLLNEVLWPTGGKVTYAYGSAPVGTEVSTYYATSRNVYYDPTHLSLTQQINPVLVNGQMLWSNSTISDGTTTRGYLNYNFQNSNNLMKVYAKDGNGALQRITETDSDSAGRTTATKIFSPSGTLLAQSSFSYDSWGNTIYSNDNIGHETWFSYANANPTKSFGSSGCTTSFYSQSISPNIHDLIVGSCDYQNGSGSPQQQTYYGYDSAGNLLKQKVLHSGAWLYTNHTYDTYGNVISTTDANGHTTYYRYSSTYSSAYLTKQSILVGTQNVTTTYTYDSAKGFLLSETDPNGQTTSYQYDALGRQTTVTYPAIGGVSATKQWFYYDNNNTMKVIDENGHITKEAFDGLARLTSVQKYNSSSLYSTESYAYNWCDTVSSKTTAALNTYTYSYDYQCRQTKLTNPDTTYATTSYDDVNNLKTISDENGHQTVYAYDWNQRLTSVKQYNSSTNYFQTSYSYDKSGNLLSVTDAKRQQTGYQYDDLNRLTTTTFPDTKTETRTYDSVGNLLSRTPANGSAISYTYDALNRLNRVTYPGSGGTVTYTYDQDSNRLSMVNPSATDYYSYDARDRLTNLTEYASGVKYMTLYAYDGAGDITSLTYPDGYALAMVYDGLNRLKKAGTFATVGYTVDDKISKITYGNGEVATYSYDTRDRPTQILDKYGSTKELSLNYTYDGTGNVLTLNTESYGYDWLNRLTSSSGPWGSYAYAYDQVGNRIRMVQGSTTTVYCYGSFNRLSGYYTTSSCSSPSTSYTYDANGNAITKTGGWTYSYDYENRLMKAVQSGTTVQTNSYDGDGNRVTQTAGSSTFTYSYQGLNILYEKNVTSGTTTVTKRFYANGLQVAKMVGTGVYYLHQDALGSTRLVATATVTIKFSSNYVPYGQNYAVSGKEVFMYTGKPYDSATGLYYYGARYYDATTGRFVTQDTYSGSKIDPMSMNLYIYARDNPERMIDPNGHMFLTSATMIDGIIARNWSAPPPAPSTATDYTDINRVSYASSPLTVTVGTSVKSVDVTFIQQGKNKYVDAPAVGIESSTSTSPFTNQCGANPCQSPQGINWKQVEAVGVSTGLTVIGTVALVIQLPEVLAVPYGDVIYGAQVNAIAGGIRGTWSYEASPGPEGPSPQGAFSAFGKGEETGILGWLIGLFP